MLSWTLHISPLSAEAEYWARSISLRGYLGLVDSWAWMTLILLYALQMNIRLLWCDGALLGSSVTVISACAQRSFMRMRPTLYWRHRNTITCANILVCILAWRLYPISGAALARQAVRQSRVRPAWTLAASTLVVAGFIQQTILGLIFPIGVSSAFVTCVLFMVVNADIYKQQALIALSHPALAPGVSAVCEGIHRTLGTLLILSPSYVEDEISSCIRDSSWVIRYSQFLGSSLAVYQAYLMELRLKVTFLKERGMFAVEPYIIDQMLLALAFPVAAYGCAYAW